ncbi:MAG: hypothetical protein OQK98_14685 [Gammaproteobacteria bacterium]|nr:hypothetical protein [Gammaproteobacteria bacterium]
MSNKDTEQNKLDQDKTDQKEVDQVKVGQEKVDQEKIYKDEEFITLHKEYQSVSTEMPAESTDSNILRAAHSALNSQDEKNHKIVTVKPRKVNKHAWYVPVSYVAIIVISLSVFLKLAFETELIEIEPNGAGFAEESFLLEVDRSYSDKQDKSLSEQEISIESLQRQKTELQAARSDEMSRLKRKQRAASEKNVQLQHQAASASLATPAPLKSEAVKENAAAAEIVSPKALMSLPADESKSVMDSAAEVESESGWKPQSLIEKMPIEAENERQMEQISELVRLFENRQLEKLRKALLVYRKSYPYNKETDLLPQAIQEQEKRWLAEKEVKSSHN